jgi:hypothetical protein
MLQGESLQGADGEGLVALAASALVLTGVGADDAEGREERVGLLDYR